MIPDGICVMKTNGDPLTNADLEEGMEVALIGIPCHENWTRGGAFDVYRNALSHFGYEGDYRSLRELNR